MNNGIDWEAHFGSSPDKWTDEQFKMAMFSTVSNQNTILKSLPCAAHTQDIQTLLNCNITKTESIKGRYLLFSGLISGGLVILGGIILKLLS